MAYVRVSRINKYTLFASAYQVATSAIECERGGIATKQKKK
jgi:hypothetical protein